MMKIDPLTGKFVHPLIVMKRENPGRYEKVLAKMSESRKNLYRKERRRMLFGMARLSNLSNVVMCKYKTSQVNHRSSALRRGYIIFDDCSEQGGERYNIYYDDSTKRSKLFEKNLIKDGFSVKKWQ
jgi:hypothetical protein